MKEEIEYCSQAEVERKRDDIWEYIFSDRQFYGTMPYNLGHFDRVLKKYKVIDRRTDKEALGTLLEVFCQENMLVRVGDEYMLCADRIEAESERQRSMVCYNAFLKVWNDKLTAKN